MPSERLFEAVGELRAIGGSGVVVVPCAYIFEEEPARYRAMLDALDERGEVMIAIYTTAEAQRTILRRAEALEPEESPALRQGMARIFGEEISPTAAVTRILGDVRAARGDAALYDWTQRIDGVALERLTVDPAELRAAQQAFPPACGSTFVWPLSGFVPSTPCNPSTRG